jgi:hypothetical protein
MAKSKRFKKKGKEVPDELPDLAVDDLKKDLEEAVSGEPAPVSENGNGETPANQGEKVPENQEVAPAPAEEQPAQEPVAEETPVQEAPATEEQPTEPVAEEQPATEEQPAQEPVAEETPVQEAPATEEQPTEEIQNSTQDPSSLDPDKSFFNNLSKELDKDKIDIEKLNEWYKQKFPKGDALEDMKDYWEDKKDELIVESIGKEYKKKIKESMQNLQKLEGEWQKIYFDLVTKEEEMKNQEKHLKSTIKEFTQIVKKRKENKSERDPESKKKTNIKKERKK